MGAIRGVIFQQKERQIPDSRWSHVRWYLTEEGKEYNDIEMVYDEAAYEKLVEAGKVTLGISTTHRRLIFRRTRPLLHRTIGMDVILAKHFANLYIRDPLVVYTSRLEQDDEKSNEHFEVRACNFVLSTRISGRWLNPLLAQSIQSTVWQTLRFKPPLPPSCNSDMGWRVEFRSMEVQLTDFENAAFAIFIVLLSRALLKFGGGGGSGGVRWGLPISKVRASRMLYRLGEV